MNPLQQQLDCSVLLLLFVKTSQIASFERAVNAHQQISKEYEGTLEVEIGNAIQSRALPEGVVGLIPDGDRKIEWRWKGPVFEDGTEDILNSSIVVRNLQELGVNSIEALRYLFPDKTDEERSAMLSGYPFRMAQATQQSLGTFLTLIENMRQVPHPQAPDLPLLADPKLDLTPYIYRALDFLKRELTYAGQYSDATGTSDPAGLDPIERARADAGLPINSGPERPTFVPDSFGAAAGGQLPADGSGGPQANPWQQAFERLSDSLSATRSSQPQAAYSTPTPQAAPSQDAAWPVSAPAQYQAAPSVSGLQTSIPQATPAYSQAPTQAPSYSSEQTQLASDEYLANVSDESLEVLQHFGAEAPALLNRYSCVVEDALLAQAQQTAEVMQQLEQLDGRHAGRSAGDRRSSGRQRRVPRHADQPRHAGCIRRGLLWSRRSLPD